jgi:hypothetical protein
MEIVPITLQQGKDFVNTWHRHNAAPLSWKFGVGLQADETLVGVAMAGRPIARHFDNGRTLEVNRTCVLSGFDNANSMLYGAVWRAAKAMGYLRLITYTQQDESGASLRAAGFVKVKDLAPRGSWSESSVKYRHKKIRSGMAV